MSLHAPPPTGADDYLVGRRAAWFAFAMTFALMLVDFIDRQVIVSLLPYIKTEWGLSDKQLGGLVSVVSVDRRARRAADRADRRPHQPGEEHRRHGHGVEPRDDLVHVRAQLQPALRGARARRARRGRLRSGRRRADREPLPGAPARATARRVLGGGLSRVGARRGARRRDRRALGLAGGFRRGRGTGPAPRAALPESPRLRDGGPDPVARRGDRLHGEHGEVHLARPGPLAHPALSLPGWIGTAHRALRRVGLAAELPQPRP